MANKSISELTEAITVNNQDLFVLEQGGLAKKMTAETFITTQSLIDALASALDGHGGIQSVTLSSVSGRIRTYLITFTDGSATTFQVLDGTSIDRIAKTSTAGLVDTYTIFMSDGTTSFFSITNGADGDVSSATLSSELAKKAPVIKETTATSAIATFADGADNMPMQNVVTEIDPVQNFPYGDPYPAGSGKNKLQVTAESDALFGVTVTVNSDGTITLVGTLTKNLTFVLNPDLALESGDWIYSGEGFGSLTSANGGFYASSGTDATADVIINAHNGSVSFTGTVGRIWLYFNSGTVLNNTLKLMIRPATIADSSFAPYSNICPITGHTEANVTRRGKNLCPVNTISGVGWGANNSTLLGVINSLPIGTYNMSFLSTLTSLNSESYLTSQWMTGFIFVNPNGNFQNMASTSTSHPVGSTQTANNVLTITSSTVGAFTHAYVYGAGNNTDGNIGTATLSEIQFELGSSKTTYEEYKGSSTATLSWQTEAGTVYGGTIDVATGLLTVERVSITIDGAEQYWYAVDNRPNIYDVVFTNTDLAPIHQSTDVLTNQGFTPTAYNYAAMDNNIPSVCLRYNESSQWRIYIATSNTTLATLKTYLGNNPLQIVYPLATPQTYLLSAQQLATLYGTNNVWSDLGDVTVTYPADTKMYIEKLTIPSEDDLVANQAITSGQYFMIGNSLYLALANIASGAAITIGTNAQRVSLADALNTINA